MGFDDRAFDVFVILGNPQATPVWTASMWGQIAPMIDPLVVAARNRAAVRTTQLRRGAGLPNQRSISFGRIGWNESGHRKWVHPDPVAGECEDAAEFLSTEVWAPSWTVCEKSSARRHVLRIPQRSIFRAETGFQSLCHPRHCGRPIGRGMRDWSSERRGHCRADWRFAASPSPSELGLPR